ncbi:MAG: 2-dehydropantoate 2-reductase [Pseudomonadales bacterium]|nr:2-dehydropantoate 2-reductase [Pseudomonadales bacterium]
MKICIVGCGAIGGLLAAYLSKTNAEITVVERGEQFLALRERGLSLRDTAENCWQIDALTVVDSLSACATFDVVFLAVKAHEIEPLVAELPRVFAPHTTLVTLQNGIPWWYFQRHGGNFEHTVLHSVDPGGRLSAQIDPARILGCVAYPAAQIMEPGVIRHIEGVRFPLGELDGSDTPRARQLSGLLTEAGLKSPVLEDIRGEIWLKAWGNLAFNPVSALTHATMAEIAIHPHSRDYVVQLMSEAREVAKQLGVEFRVPLERRLQGAEQVGGHKTSMLQDVLARRPLELDAILGAVIEIAALVDVAVPALKGLYGLCSLRNEINLGHRIVHG